MFVLLVAHFITNVFLSCGHDFIQFIFLFFSFIGQYSVLFLALLSCLDYRYYWLLFITCICLSIANKDWL